MLGKLTVKSRSLLNLKMADLFFWGALHFTYMESFIKSPKKVLTYLLPTYLVRTPFSSGSFVLEGLEGKTLVYAALCNRLLHTLREYEKNVFELKTLSRNLLREAADIQVTYLFSTLKALFLSEKNFRREYIFGKPSFLMRRWTSLR